jgi:hypothetical protein
VKEYFCFHAYKSSLDTATGGLNVNIISQVVVYTPAERAEKLLPFLLYPYLLFGRETPESVFENVYGAPESILPDYVACRAGTSNKVVVPARQAGNRFLGSSKSLQIRALLNTL